MQFLFDNLFIGIISGIISGVLVSRIFVLQGDFQNQITYFEAVLKRLAYARISLEMHKKILELKYDTREAAKKEALEKNYNSVEQYYSAHNDKDWISATDAINVINQQMSDYIEKSAKITFAVEIKDKELAFLYNKAITILDQVKDIKDISFASINKIIDKIDYVEREYRKYRNDIKKKLLILFLKDKVVFIIIILLLIVITGFVCVRLP